MDFVERIRMPTNPVISSEPDPVLLQIKTQTFLAFVFVRLSHVFKSIGEHFVLWKEENIITATFQTKIYYRKLVFSASSNLKPR